MTEYAEGSFFVQAEGRNLRYQWIKDGVALNSSSDNGMKYNGSEKEQHLTIRNIREADEGEYWCQVWSSDNESRKIYSKHAKLRLGKHIRMQIKYCNYLYIYTLHAWFIYITVGVMLMYNNEMSNFNDTIAVDLPSIAVPPPESIPIQKMGETITISVTAGSAPGLKYEWSKIGGPMPPAYRCRGVRTNVLTILQVQESDAGLYRCRVKNEFGYIDTRSVKVSIGEC